MRRPSKTSCSRTPRLSSINHNNYKNLEEYKYVSLDPQSTDRLTPYLRGVARVLDKVGSERRKDVFQPNEAEQKDYLKRRQGELRSQFRGHSQKLVPFKLQIDEIVLDCKNNSFGNDDKSIWQKYRNEVHDLSFRVLRLNQRRRGSFFL